MKTYEEIEKKYENLFDDYLDWLVETIHDWTENYPDGSFSSYKIIVTDEELKNYCRDSVDEWFIPYLVEADEAQEEYNRYIEIEKKIDNEEKITDEEKSYYDSYEGYEGRYFNYDKFRDCEPLDKFHDIMFCDNEGLRDWFYPDICEEDSTIAREKTEEELEAEEEENRKFHQYDH